MNAFIETELAQKLAAVEEVLIENKLTKSGSILSSASAEIKALYQALEMVNDSIYGDEDGRWTTGFSEEDVDQIHAALALARGESV